MHPQCEGPFQLSTAALEMCCKQGAAPKVKGSFTSVPPSGTPNTDPPSRASQPATIRPACSIAWPSAEQATVSKF